MRRALIFVVLLLSMPTGAWANRVQVDLPELPRPEATLGPLRLDVRDLRFASEDGARVRLPRVASPDDRRPQAVGDGTPPGLLHAADRGRPPTLEGLGDGTHVRYRTADWTVADLVAESLIRGMASAGVEVRTLGAPEGPLLVAEIEHLWCVQPERRDGRCDARVRLLLLDSDGAAPRWTTTLAASRSAAEFRGREDPCLSALFADLAHSAWVAAPTAVVASMSVRPRPSPQGAPGLLELRLDGSRAALGRFDIGDVDIGVLRVHVVGPRVRPLSVDQIVRFLDEPLLTARYRAERVPSGRPKPTRGASTFLTGGGLALGFAAGTLIASIPAAFGSIDWCYESETSCGPAPVYGTLALAGAFGALGGPLVAEGAVRSRRARRALQPVTPNLEDLVRAERLWEAIEAYNRRVLAPR